ncbi:hypothetical protein A3H10_01650 [Candidatus Uhrbacteria bacterium RIFCSPLOWO2_12_FULL_46_10]|uniref:Uncharacterized protein n=1 Tax=Candidatus Uhrbacteria bacterium RIFCSPLOWO2_01_FULL_47_25 TaxID=1802402 RepID=A0A1F7UTC9_9BACT|nr:MAG: hypothetical protein UX68_C0008G0047 [Parcubacteria group bacterium GW2011_GWA2_46_9]OGL60487.1 MAG: hypothetical protein A2752_05315 [Candidatus Uhrbacteria bacterium RIFCSPHIGHO2_01_FULL_46_23]OGL67823.1 MAG: hypothetical protein A3D60_01135 [Candidatus Uhrbacteria bacterium RIFCSPHIGHO2_02_FULL_47_29]OGL75529.1 MAG: hypothetical protein A3E96_03685 [Candidatus Uhrbacteria bacterium RIFCSPHIGHO2_12_FULL_46_13]OGL81560.1 MAG: hypothetical protein A2936_01835 [Candidatus Uhrbacteria bac
MERSKDEIARDLSSLPLELLRGNPPDAIGKQLVDIARELGLQIEDRSDGLFETIAERGPDDLASEIVRFSYALMGRGKIADLSPRRQGEFRRAMRQLRQWTAQPPRKRRRPKSKRRSRRPQKSHQRTCG